MCAHHVHGAKPRSTPEVTSPWKHEHSGPHLSRSWSCPRSRKKHFLAPVSSQGSLAPVSCFWSGRGILWWPLGQLRPCGGRACQSPLFPPQKPRCSDQLGVGREPGPPRPACWAAVPGTRRSAAQDAGAGASATRHCPDSSSPRPLIKSLFQCVRPAPKTSPSTCRVPHSQCEGHPRAGCDEALSKSLSVCPGGPSLRSALCGGGLEPGWGRGV